MNSIVYNIEVLKGHRNGQITLKKALLSMNIGETINLIHNSFYCQGAGRKCRVSHLITELHEEGLGKWSSKHVGIGKTLISRIK